MAKITDITDIFEGTTSLNQQMCWDIGVWVKGFCETYEDSPVLVCACPAGAVYVGDGTCTGNYWAYPSLRGAH